MVPNGRSETYGAATRPADAAKPHRLYHGRRLNVLAICLALFVPWMIFCCVYAARSFSIRYQSPELSWAIVVVALLLVLVAIGLAYTSLQKKWHHDPRYQPMWYIFLAITMLLAWILAMVMGEWNWNMNMSGSFGMKHLNDYAHVDPSRMRGQQIMDAGSVYFVNGTHLDTRLALGFRNDDVYCVAPIVMGAAPLASYDFWAVGMNCCNGSPGNFACGEYNNVMAAAGLRLMKDGQRDYFRLAVQQAEAMFNIQAEHPLFFYWVQDPIAEMNSMYADGWKFYTIGMFSHFFLQLFLVLIAVVCYGKVGAY